MEQGTKNPDPLPDAPATVDHRARVAETFDREYPRLLAWLSRKVPREDAKEILSSTFTQLLAQPDEPISRMAAYVRTTVENRLANYYRDKAGRREKLRLLEPDKPEDVPSPESVLMEGERNAILSRVIRQLPPRVRLAVVLRQEGLSNQEIVDQFAAERLYVVERSIQRYLKQAYEACREALEALEGSKKEGNP